MLIRTLDLAHEGEQILDEVYQTDLFSRPVSTGQIAAMTILFGWDQNIHPLVELPKAVVATA